MKGFKENFFYHRTQRPSQSKPLLNKISQIFPLFNTLKTYTRKDVLADFLASLTVWVILVPQGMAYAFLAGLPPIYGLYGGLVPLFLYGIFGSSRQLSIGPVAITALLLIAGISQIAEPFSEEYVSLVILAGLYVGIFQVVLGTVRLGFLVSFLSHPVVAGFISAAAIIIIINQFKDILGISVPRFPNTFQTLMYDFQHLGESNWIALSMGFGSILFIGLVKKIHKAIPAYLLVVLIGTLLSYLFSLDSYGLEIIGAVPEGLPKFSVPDINFDTFLQLIYTTILPVLIIGIVESIGIAKNLEAKHGDHTISPNQELLALGIAKIGGAFFQAMPSSGSFGRSAVNSNGNAKSGLSSIFTAIFILFSLLFLTPLFYYLPKAILAGIILMAVKGLIDWKEAKHLWKVEKHDFYMMLITFIATLVLGIGEGVLVGVVVSVSVSLYKSSKPHIAELGSMPGSTHYRNISRFEEAKISPEFLIVRMDEQLYFANADYFKQEIKLLVESRTIPPAYLLLNSQSIHYLDSTGMHALTDLHKYLDKKGIKLVLCGVIGPVRDKMFVSGLMELIGKENFFLYVHHAVNFLTGKDSNAQPETEWTDHAIQTDIESH